MYIYYLYYILYHTALCICMSNFHYHFKMFTRFLVVICIYCICMCYLLKLFLSLPQLPIKWPLSKGFKVGIAHFSTTTTEQIILVDVVEAENIPEVIWSNTAVLTVFGRLKIRICSVVPTVVWTTHFFYCTSIINWTLHSEIWVYTCFLAKSILILKLLRWELASWVIRSKLFYN